MTLTGRRNVNILLILKLSMLSPLATPDVAARPAPHNGERELKFTLPEGRVDFARRWLERICRRDPKFPEAVVWTIYSTTRRRWFLWGEKINSDYLKWKIRVPWYSAPLRVARRAQRSSKPSFALGIGVQRSALDSPIRPKRSHDGISRIPVCVGFRCSWRNTASLRGLLATRHADSISS